MCRTRRTKQIFSSCCSCCCCRVELNRVELGQWRELQLNCLDILLESSPTSTTTTIFVSSVCVYVCVCAVFVKCMQVIQLNFIYCTTAVQCGSLCLPRHSTENKGNNNSNNEKKKHKNNKSLDSFIYLINNKHCTHCVQWATETTKNS